MALSSGRQAVALENLEKLRNMTREAILEMRLLIFELHPAILEKEGLAAALQVRLAAVESRAGLQTEIRVDGEERVPIPIRQELYRIAQESLNNVVKHANAHEVTLHLKFDDLSVCMEIHDDGIGFNSKVAHLTGGMGLRGIKERVQKIGGKLEIKSSPKAGTTLRVTAPIKKI
jgi:signal transduction histidine kinase